MGIFRVEIKLGRRLALSSCEWGSRNLIDHFSSSLVCYVFLVRMQSRCKELELVGFGRAGSIALRRTKACVGEHAVHPATLLYVGRIVGFAPNWAQDHRSTRDDSQ